MRLFYSVSGLGHDEGYEYLVDVITLRKYLQNPSFVGIKDYTILTGEKHKDGVGYYSPEVDIYELNAAFQVLKANIIVENAENQVIDETEIDAEAIKRLVVLYSGVPANFESVYCDHRFMIKPLPMVEECKPVESNKSFWKKVADFFLNTGNNLPNNDGIRLGYRPTKR